MIAAVCLLQSFRLMAQQNYIYEASPNVIYEYNYTAYAVKMPNYFKEKRVM